MVIPYSLLTETDIYLFREGNHFSLQEKLGSHLIVVNGEAGVFFAVWAPNAESVSVIGDFNGWNRASHPLTVRWDSSGIWEGFIPGVNKGAIYKYFIRSKNQGQEFEKGDPFALSWEVPPRTASVVWDLNYKWQDSEWMATRKEKNGLESPISIYEMHFGSWRSDLDYQLMAEILPDYIKSMGFTHVEFMPLMEHPFYGSWGYQKVGYFAPSSRYGTPQEFMHLIDVLHQNGIGVIMDWVASHFPSDLHGLAYYDGTNLFEHEDKRKGFHPEWNSYIFNYGRHEVRSFLISSASFWLEKYHIDGLRCDAVSSMLYLDYARKHNEWIPNVFGGNENLEAKDFIRRLNEHAYQKFPDVMMIAEESTAWPMVSRPTHTGGLGFGFKWNMGWMHDTLRYFSKDPIHRKYHHNELLFSMIYAYNENFILSISHDEVVHGKGSLLGKMPGDDWQKFANLRLLKSYMYSHPGKKLLFMGAELATRNEWNHDSSQDWDLLQHAPHQGINKIVKDLNKIYRKEKALHELDFVPEGFQWININDIDNCVISYLRKGRDSKDAILVVCNFTPVPRHPYSIGVPYAGKWQEIFNSDSSHYGGTNVGNPGHIETVPESLNGHAQQLTITVPPLGAVFLKCTIHEQIQASQN